MMQFPSALQLLQFWFNQIGNVSALSQAPAGFFFNVAKKPFINTTVHFLLSTRLQNRSARCWRHHTAVVGVYDGLVRLGGSHSSLRLDSDSNDCSLSLLC